MLEEEAMNLSWNGSRNDPGVVLNEVLHPFIDRELERRGFFSNSLIINPFIEPQQDRMAISQILAAAKLKDICQGSNPFPDARSNICVSGKPDRIVPEVSTTEPGRPKRMRSSSSPSQL